MAILVVTLLINYLLHLRQHNIHIIAYWSCRHSLQPVYSDGVTITPDAPRSTGIISASLTDTNLTFTWSKFTDPYIGSLTATVVSRHEWTLIVSHGEGYSPEHIYNWRLLTDVDMNCNQTTNSTNDVSFAYTLKDNVLSPQTTICINRHVNSFNMCLLPNNIF